ncbi:diacylglycerol/lipid kinase family protein [Parasphingorhabdus pacifica]
MRSVLLIDSSAGRGRAAEVARPVAGHLRAVSEVRVVVTKDPAGSAKAAAESVAAGADVVAVLGGDGAVHRTVQACAGTESAVAAIPIGMSNDFARATGIPLEPVAAARAVAATMAEQAPRRIDLGKVVGGRWFSTVLCAGFDSRVGARANRVRRPFGKYRYDLALLRELVDLRTMPLRVEADGEATELHATSIAVGNTAWYGGGIPICPSGDPGDGEFDVTVIGDVSRATLLRMLPAMRTGHHVDHPEVRTFRTSSLRLGGPNGWFTHADGEPQARLPLSLRCSPGALKVIAPASDTVRATAPGEV